MKYRKLIRGDEEQTSREHKMARKNLLDCSRCPPHRKENRRRHPAHPPKKKRKPRDR